jgi:Transglutaminase-like superfamily
VAWWTSSRRRLGELARLAPWERKVVAEGLVLNVLFAKVTARRGFRCAQGLAERLGGRSTRPHHDPARIAQLVAHAAPLTATTCVPRSLTTFTLLRRDGHQPTVRFGVDPAVIDLLDAHAWVEVDGRPVGENDDIERYLTLTSIGEA